MEKDITARKLLLSIIETTQLRGHRKTAHIKIKEIKKRRALIGKQRVELLMNSVGKRTVVLLNPSFFTSLIPSSLCAI
jgi:hypothetical protein